VLSQLGLGGGENSGLTSRLVSCILSLGLNSAMVAVFSRALAAAPTAAEASLVSTAANLLSTGLLAAVVCGERVTLGWAAGAGLVCAGLALLTRGEESNKED